MARMYSVRGTSELGIGKSVYFSTEQHPRKSSDTFGVLTLHCEERMMDEQVQGQLCKKVVVKCTKILPVLRGVINKDMLSMSRYSRELKEFINQHVNRAYRTNNTSTMQWPRDKKEENCAPTANKNMTSGLSDALYVLDVNFVSEDVKKPDEWAPWANDSKTDKKKETVLQAGPRGTSLPGANKTAIDKKKTMQKGDSPVGTIVSALHLPKPVAENIQTEMNEDTAVENATSVLMQSARNTGIMKNSVVEISFSRTEDVPLIMQACHYFFKNLRSSTNTIISIKFENGQIPMWFRLLHNTAPDFRKIRSTFSDEEACGQILDRHGWHFSTWFTFDDKNVDTKKRLRSDDGTWSELIFIDFDKLHLHHEQMLLPCNPSIT